MSRSHSSTNIDRFRETVFCSSNPNKELNPAKHIKKRSMQAIISGQDTSSGSTAIIKNNNLNSYSFYNKENTKNNNNLASSMHPSDQTQQETLNYKKPTGKKIFKDQPQSQQLQGNTRGSKIVDQNGTPIVDQQILHSRKGSGQYNMTQSRLSHQSDTRNQPTKKMFENLRTNKETITNELQTIHLSNQLTPGYLKSTISQRKTIPQYTSIQYCLNMEKNDNIESNNKPKQIFNVINKDDRCWNSQQQQQTLQQNNQSQSKNATPARNQLSSNQIKIPERRVQRSNTSSNMATAATTTTQDAFGLNYNKPPLHIYYESNQRLGLDKKRETAKNTRTHESFYL